MTNKNQSAATESLGYNIQIMGRHLQVTEAMKQHALDKLAKVERFHNHILNVHVTMDIQRMEHSVSIVIKFEHFKIKSHASSTDMYVSIDQAVERLQTQIRRWKERIQDHTKKKLSFVDMKVNVLKKPYDELEDVNAEIEAVSAEAKRRENRPGTVIGEETRSLKELTIHEAVMKMELSGDRFLLYRSEEDRKLKVIYRRKDGNYGIIQPEG